MQTKVIEETVTRERTSKYGRAFTAMLRSLDSEGADGRLRAVVSTSKWKLATLKRWRQEVAAYARRHPVDGYRLRLQVCVRNGLVFCWEPVPGTSEG